MKKRLLSILIAVSLMVSVLSTNAFATNYDANRIISGISLDVGSSYANSYCLRWVCEQFSKYYGLSLKGGTCCAYYVGNYTVDSQSMSNVPAGAVVFFSGGNTKCGSGHTAGHIGISVGNGYMVHAFNWDGKGTKICKDSISSVANISWYTYMGWGWFADVELPYDNRTFDIKDYTTYPEFAGVIKGYTSGIATSSFEISFLQAALKDFGYSIDCDGFHGPGSTAVLKTFQTNNGLTANGNIDEATWNKVISMLKEKYGAEKEKEMGEEVVLDITNPATYPKFSQTILAYTSGWAKSSDDILFIQKALKDLGYDIECDGYFGPAATAVVKSFQTSKGLTANGSVNENTWNTIVDLLTQKYSNTPEIGEGKVDEPIVDEPVVDEPVVDEPVVDEPVVDEPVVDEPVVDEPVVDEPVVDEPVTEERNNPFKDIFEDDYYFDAALWAFESEITLGTSDTTFSPDVICTRSQAVAFLWRASNSPEPKTLVNPFVDVETSDYYYKAVLWAVENGITTGTGNNCFSPYENCTNAQILTFLWRTMGSPNKTNNSVWYGDALNWAESFGLLEGTYTGMFIPDNNSDRASLVTYLYRYFNREA